MTLLGAVDPARVAEVIVDRGPGVVACRGSGYRVTATAVLTAAHVVRGGVAGWVRFSPGQEDEWAVPLTGWWADEPGESDLAVLQIPARRGERPLPAVEFGCLSRRDAVVDWRAVGFPLFKLRAGDAVPAGPLVASADGSAVLRYRDSEQARGTIAVLSNARENTFALKVASTVPDRQALSDLLARLDIPLTEVSPWEGMSGAAVWVGGRIVGVVSRHHHSEGLDSLAAAPLDAAYAAKGGSVLPGGAPSSVPAEVAAAAGLPQTIAGLVDLVTPSAVTDAVLAAYLAEAESIGPAQLLDRQQEWAELVEFCAGETACAWWQAGPWAGKTALASWLATHPPVGVEVASFFVTARLAGQSTADAYLTAMLEQLAALAGLSQPTVAGAAGRRGAYRNMLTEAAHAVTGRGRRLLLLVDGLDEDVGSADGSIAVLLPADPPPGMRVLVTSRVHPGLPADVPRGHWLRTITPRSLRASPYAQDIKDKAIEELTWQLNHGSPLHTDILGLITASGGGLTLTDLTELTRRPRYEVEHALSSPLARSLRIRARAQDRVYLFGHETLRDLAEDTLADILASYRDRLHAWAEDCRDRGWPDSTPGYLLRGYPRLLQAAGDISRMVALATDWRRHDRLLAATHTDAAALTEVTTTQTLILQSPVSDLAALAVLAAHRDRLTTRNSHIPASLPAIWARLGHIERARTLARSLSGNEQAEALCELAVVIAAEDPAQAEELARRIDNDYLRADALAEVAGAVAAADPALAGEISRTIPRDAMETFVVAAAGAVAAIDPDRGEEMARSVAFDFQQSQALAGVAAAVAASDPDRGEAIARSITGDDLWQTAALAGVARSVAATQPDRARRLAKDAEAIARGTAPHHRPRALALVAGAVAVTDLDRGEAIARSITSDDWASRPLGGAAAAIAAVSPDRGEAIARTIADADRLAHALTDVAGAVLAADPGRARKLAEEAETIARNITIDIRRAETLYVLAGAVAAIDPDRGEAIARSIDKDGRQPEALSAVAVAIARGDPDRGEAIARSIDTFQRSYALAAVAGVVAAADPDRGEEIARTLSDQDHLDRALAEVAEAVAAANPDRAEALARGIADQYGRARALARVAAAVAALDPNCARRLAGDAEAIARGINDEWRQVWALYEVAPAIGAVDPARGEAIALSLPDEYQSARIQVAGAAATTDPDRAEAIARRLDDYQQAEAFARAAKTVAAADPDRARRWLAEQLTRGSWMEVLEAVGLLAPSAVIAAADAIGI